MRRVHFPFQFAARLQLCSSCARRPGSLRTVQRSISTKPVRARTIFSGIQPTGIPHVRFSFFSQSYVLRSNLSLPPQLGNYFGALANWVRLQDAAAPEDRLFFSVVGWHALTLPQDPKALLEARTTMIALILASGVDPRRSIIFHQDEVKATLLLGILAHAHPTGSKPCRAGMDSELPNTAWEAETDDHLESTSLCERERATTI